MDLERDSDYAWVVRGKQRRRIIEAMTKAKIPTQLKKDTAISLNNVSDVLRELRKRKLVRCVNPKEKTGRLYTLTKKGTRVRELLEE